ncbi:MAG: calcium-binding protein [Phenylobacterium sp.]
MPSVFAFETITAAQALAITPADALVFFSNQPLSGVHASAATVLYDSPSLITVSVAGHAVDFGVAIEGASLAGRVQFFDGSNLFIGDDNANTIAAGSTTGSALYGGLAADSLQAGGAFDLLQGNAGNDILQSTGGFSTLYGGQDNDTIVVSGPSNFVQGNKGADTIQGQAQGVDTLLGGQGDDHITGGGVLDGNLGDDVLSGTGQLLGEDGDDTLISPGAHDVLSGGNGNDSLSATHGADSVNGGAGDDTIDGSSTASTLAGGGGSDKFILGTGSTAPGGGAQIVDWDGAHDTLHFTGFTPTATNFATATAADYASALATAANLIDTQPVSFVEVQVGADVFVFVGTPGFMAADVELVGRGLADFTPHNLI